jgi:hypothetical protein
MEAIIMQESARAGSETQSPIPNPILDVAIAVLEGQLKAWQAYQVEGTRFIARRLRADLEYLRALGHCCDIESTGECQRAWLRDAQKDYAEEWGRLVATGFALSFGELSGFGSLFLYRPSSAPAPAKQPGKQENPRPDYQAAA